MSMGLFDSSQINQLILKTLYEENYLPHAEIVKRVTQELGLSSEVLEEREKNNLSEFSHKVAGQEQSLKTMRFIERVMAENKKNGWRITEEGKKHLEKLKSSSYVVNDYSVVYAYCKETGIKIPKLKKGSTYLYKSEDKNMAAFFVINPNKEDMRGLKEAMRNYRCSKEVKGVVFCPQATSFAQEENIETVYYHMDIKIQDNQSEIKDSHEIMPLSENALSDFIVEHYLSSNDKGFHKDKKIHPREFHIGENRRIDILCRDSNDNLLVIENKINPKTDFHVVGQIMYYLYHVENTCHEKPKGIILLPNNVENPQIIRDTLQLCKDDLDIQLMFYSLILTFCKSI